MTEFFLIIQCMLWLVFSAFYSGVETGVYSLSKVRLKYESDSGDRRAVAIRKLFRRPGMLITAILLGNNIANYFSSAALTKVVGSTFGGGDALATAAIVTVFLAPVTMIFSEIVPKNVYNQRPARLVPASVYVVAATRILLFPFVLFFNFLPSLLSVFLPRKSEMADPALTRQKVEALVSESAALGGVSDRQRRIFASVIEVEEYTVRRSMLPLGRVVMIPAALPTEKLRELIQRTRYTRYPVYEGKRENVIGYVNCYDYVFRGEPDLRAASCLRPIIRVAADERIVKALLRMKANHEAMALVEDNGGRAVGVITLRDLVEEIVGELKH